MATALLMFSHIQFSNFRLANNHMPAQAVALTKASITGTTELVKYFNTKIKVQTHPRLLPSLFFCPGNPIG